MMHASRIGVDSHGARLVPHYAAVLGSGRVNPRPEVRITRKAAAVAVVDGDDGLGHHAAYRAMQEAVAIAREAGIGAVGVGARRTSAPPGPIPCWRRRRTAGFATSNADFGVTLFGGRVPFHGTNPFAFAAPSGGGRPWLLDMATSSIPFNRVLLYRVLGNGLPPGVAADAEGAPTRDPDAVRMLLPLGGEGFGFKGAALAGLATILSAVLQGATLDHAMIPMVGGEDMATPRGIGHFCPGDPARRLRRAGGLRGGDGGLSRRAARVAGAGGRGADGAGGPGNGGSRRSGSVRASRSIRRRRRSSDSEALQGLTTFS